MAPDGELGIGGQLVQEGDALAGGLQRLAVEVGAGEVPAVRGETDSQGVPVAADCQLRSLVDERSAG